MNKRLEVDETLKFKTPLYEGLVRTGTVGEGSCLFHSILKAVDSEYSSLSKKQKIEYMKRFRNDLSKNVTIDYYKNVLHIISKFNLDMELTLFFNIFYKFIENPSPFLKSPSELFSNIISNNTIAYQIITTVLSLSDLEKIRELKSLSGANTVDEYTQKLYEEMSNAFTNDINDLEIDQDKIDICKDKLKELIFQVCNYLVQKGFVEYKKTIKDVSEWSGDEMLQFISYNMDVDIYFIDTSTRQMYNRGCDNIVSGKRRAVVLGWINANHFESIGFSSTGKSSDIQRVFEPDHPLIKKLRSILCGNIESLESKDESKDEPKDEAKESKDEAKDEPKDQTRVVNIKNKNLKEWMENPNNVYIGQRGVVMVSDGKKLVRFPNKASIWENPYSITSDDEREEVISMYRKYITEKIKEDPITYDLESLRGKNLGCWVDKCHGHVLVELIEKIKNEKKKIKTEDKKMGKVYIASMNLRGEHADRPSWSVRLNVTSAQGKENPDRLDFSPMTFIEGGYKGYPNFEAAWQSGKVFEGIPDEKVKKFWKNIKEPKRRYPDSKGVKVLYASFDWCYPGEKMDWVTSRKKVYVPFYHDLMKNKKRALYWKEKVESGTDVTIYDFDGPRLEDGTPTCLEVNIDTLREKINDTRYPFGHGYVIASFIAGIDTKHFIDSEPKVYKKIEDSDSEEEEKEESPKGLSYFPGYITKDEEKYFIDFINQQDWNSDLKRRTQHYGYKYPYDTKDKLIKTTPIPKEFIPLIERLNKQFGRVFDQVIVNEYLPGQGISGHIDHPKLFKDTVISLSLGSPCIMNFEMEDDKVEKVLDERSLVVLRDEARYKWKHSIPSRKSDKGVPRKVRISLTFREVK